ncbi:S1 RNA-binding domain-containing protein [Vibrio sp. PP-XX7]
MTSISDWQYDLLNGLNPADYTNEHFGVPTVSDIIKELDKPGRDPRPEFKTATFAEGIHKVTDLEPGMILEGVVSNVANFGAFVDIGVHQDGLVHISALTDRFVSDPRDVVKAGDIVKVKVMEIDVKENELVCQCASLDEPGQENRPTRSPQSRPSRPSAAHKKTSRNEDSNGTNNAMGGAFAAALPKAKK